MSNQIFKRSYSILAAFFCLLLVFIPITSNAQDDAVFIEEQDTTHVNDVLDWSKSLAEQQLLTEVQQSCVSSLIGEYDVLDLDVSAERILLHLSDGRQSFLRLALWDTIRGQYRIKDTGWLPAESYLDSYHDGDSILFMTSLGEDGITESTPVCDEVYLTFDYMEDDWYLTHFTDGQSFVAALQNGVYLFEDYYESSENYAWRIPHVFAFEGFNPMELIPCIVEYNTAMPNRPSLIETL